MDNTHFNFSSRINVYFAPIVQIFIPTSVPLAHTRPSLQEVPQRWWSPSGALSQLVRHGGSAKKTDTSPLDQDIPNTDLSIWLFLGQGAKNQMILFLSWDLKSNLTFGQFYLINMYEVGRSDRMRFRMKNPIGVHEYNLQLEPSQPLH